MTIAEGGPGCAAYDYGVHCLILPQKRIGLSDALRGGDLRLLTREHQIFELN